MDSKTLRLTILFSTAALVLILLVVYAANAGSRRRRGSKEAQTAETQTQELTGTGDGAYLQTIGENFRAYGEQIGNQPKAFLYDESFFDPMRDVNAGISEGDEERLELQATVMEDTIHVSIVNARGGLETGIAFQVLAEQVSTGRENTWTDTDRDGQLDLVDQENGNYRLYLLQVQGYVVPSSAVAVKVNVPTKKSSAGSSATLGSTDWADDAATGGTGSIMPGAAGTAGTMPDNALNGSSGMMWNAGFAGTGGTFVIPEPGEAGGAMGVNAE